MEFLNKNLSSDSQQAAFNAVSAGEFLLASVQDKEYNDGSFEMFVLSILQNHSCFRCPFHSAVPDLSLCKASDLEQNISHCFVIAVVKKAVRFSSVFFTTT